MKKYDLKINGNTYEVEVKNFDVTSATVSVNGKDVDVEISYPESEAPVVIPKVRKAAAAAAPVQNSAPATAATGSAINAPMPGLILKILVKAGDSVTVGQKVAVMEAMKMENDINATVAGTVGAVNVNEGDNVQENQALITIS